MEGQVKELNRTRGKVERASCSAYVCFYVGGKGRGERRKGGTVALFTRQVVEVNDMTLGQHKRLVWPEGPPWYNHKPRVVLHHGALL